MTLADIYTITLPVIATENFVMGLTLLLLHRYIPAMRPHRKGFCFLSIAMLMIALVNFIELGEGSLVVSVNATVIPAASIQLFLLFCAYMSLMKPSYVTRSFIVVELLLIILFTIPPLFVDIETNGPLFNLLLYISVAFYSIKYINCLRIYRKLYNEKRLDVLNFYSNVSILHWIRRTFYLLLIIGSVSIIMPFANYIALIGYQIFLVVAYFYIFLEVIRHATLLGQMSLQGADATVPECGNQVEEVKKVLPDLFTGKIPLCEKWIAERNYAHSGVTIDDVAMYLKTNRTTLSIYLNSELKVNFYEWISRIRIEDARKQLIDCPTLPIAEVAAYVGIEDRSNFDKLFKRIVGVSPAAYRIQHAQETKRYPKKQEVWQTPVPPLPSSLSVPR